MLWAKLFSLFVLATFKFMFSPFIGLNAMHLSVLQTWLCCFAGALSCSAFFYYSAGYFMENARKKRILKKTQAQMLGLEFKERKNFTRMNKFIVRIKRSLGIYGISFYVPLFLSIPIGSIIVAKFYGKFKKTFPLVILGIAMNATILTTLAYIFN